MAQFNANDPVVILSYARTPMGGMQGALSDASATDLGATAVKAAVERSGVPVARFDRTYMGCALPAGLGQAPARQASIKAGLPADFKLSPVVFEKDDDSNFHMDLITASANLRARNYGIPEVRMHEEHGSCMVHVGLLRW